MGQVGDLYTVEPKKEYETSKSSQPDYYWENCLIGQEPHNQPKKSERNKNFLSRDLEFVWGFDWVGGRTLFWVTAILGSGGRFLVVL